MEPEQDQRIRDVAMRAKCLSPSARQRFLDAACGAAGELREAVERELATLSREQTRTQSGTRGLETSRTSGDGSDGAFAAGPDASATPSPAPDAFPGYEIVRAIRQGGQGAVYEALQKSTKRKVAIKVLIGGQFATPAARKRFEREVETVARLHHPDIISIFHADITAEGRPYYVMDYVRGDPLSKYARDRKLSLNDVLTLFARVCRAVHHAHQRGILHRDLKPSNILVDADGNPTVLDFGLAKWLAAPVDSDVTLTREIIGSVPYMAPEQTRSHSDEIDARTDVYALGVLLYVLLTGHFPYPVTGSLAEVFRHISETPAMPPSKRWDSQSGVTSGSGTTLGSGRCPIGREVRTIVLTALAKERARRYQSAQELARDVEHYLAGEPIQARGDSLGYVIATRARTLLRRHRITSAAVAILAVAFIVQFVLVPIIFRLTPLNRYFEHFMTVTLADAPHNAFQRLRMIALTDETDVEQLAYEAGLAGVTVTENRSLRRLHGELMRRLSRSGLSALAWDLEFPGETAYDADFVAGVQALHDAGVNTVVGTPDWWRDARGLPRLSENIVPHVRWGSMTAGVSPLETWRLELFLQRGDGDPLPGLGPATLAAAWEPEAEPRYALDGATESARMRYRRPSGISRWAGGWKNRSDVIELTRIEIAEVDDPRFGVERGDRIGLLFVDLPADEVFENSLIPYHAVFRANDGQRRDWFAGRVVLVCDMRGGADRHLDPAGRVVSGSFIHATGIDALQRAVPIRMPRSAESWLLVLSAATLGMVAVRFIGGARRACYAVLTLLAAAICVGSILAYTQFQYLCNPFVLLTALLLAAVLGIPMRREVAARAWPR